MVGNFDLLTPTKIIVPKGTTAMSFTATSLYDFKKTTSGVYATWVNSKKLTQSSLFSGPSTNFMLTEDALNLPMSSVVDNIPSEIKVSFNIDSDSKHLPNVSNPIYTDAGAQGKTASFAQVLAYESADNSKTKPTTFTIQFQGK